MSLGDRIKKLRIQMGITQQDLASVVHVSDKTISSWECGRTYPEINVLFNLSSYFKVGLYKLLDENYYNQKPFEIEVKIKLDGYMFKQLLGKMKKKCNDIVEVKQLDKYYEPIDRSFSNEWLRIRDENEKFILTYKRKIEDNQCQEYESVIDDFYNVEWIIKNLGFREKGIVKKNRIKMFYKDKYELSFDEVDELGNYLEIEVKKYNFDNEKEIKDLLELLEELKIDSKLIESRRYIEIFEDNI